ncbi:MAG: glucose-1-phosphate thymidylyltransferase [Actinobacteria bacterium HGW-Actinobacteria-10]|jgi:glucose-1-phosphate thymidylyltransferase|nr:MAG: glucose-1-phosphate thymidylyltransferase [Actinobacteria bacterium HGW-Actinobacteria-10]
MKALILAGGKGTRLRPITFTRAKQLVPVANKPILFYAVEAIRDAGINEIGVIVGDTADEVMAALGDGSHWGVSITYIPQESPLGLAHAVKIAEEFMAGDPFVMYLGDNLIADGINRFVDEFLSNDCDAQILLAHVPNANQFGVAELGPDGGIVRLIEKPDDPPSDLALVGVYLFNSRVFQAVNTIEPSARGELEITDAIQWLVDQGHSVLPHVIDGWWKDTGKLEDMLEANRIMLDAMKPLQASSPGEGAAIHGRVGIGEATTIINSVVRGPAIIGDGCEVRDAYIGPYTSVGDGCKVLGSEVEHSIMLRDSRIEGLRARMADSLLGVNAVVRRTPAVHQALRVMIGDNSEVDLG